MALSLGEVNIIQMLSRVVVLVYLLLLVFRSTCSIFPSSHDANNSQLKPTYIVLVYSRRDKE